MDAGSEKRKRYVLILEDQKIGDHLVVFFKKHPAYEFVPVLARRMGELCEKLSEIPRLDVGIIDLWLPSGKNGDLSEHAGIDALKILHPLLIDTGAVFIVYTANSDIKSCVEAMKYGACDYVDKVERSPMELVDLVVAHLDDVEKRTSQINRFESEVLPGIANASDYAGKCVAILNDQIVGSGDTRLAALLDYWKGEAQKELPVFYRLPRSL